MIDLMSERSLFDTVSFQTRRAHRSYFVCVVHEGVAMSRQEEAGRGGEQLQRHVTASVSLRI